MVAKIIKIILLLLVIFLCFSFIIFRYYGNQEESNWFNDNLREEITEYPVLRGAYGLHWDGDAKSDYLSDQRYQKLLVEIDAVENCFNNFPDTSKIAEQISQLVEKPQGVEVVLDGTIDEDEMIFLASNPFDRAVDRLKDRLQNNKSYKERAVFYVMCLDYNRDNRTNVGLTFAEDSAILFYNRIKEVTESNPQSLPIYLSTTLLHEFGHQLGLGHVENNSCIMAETVESPGNAQGALTQIPSQFCPETLELIAQMQAKYDN